GLLDGAEVGGAAADDDAELHLPVGLGGPARDAHVVVRADERVRRLGEQDRLVRHRLPGLGGVVAVVEPDAQDLVRPGDGRADAFTGELAYVAAGDALIDRGGDGGGAARREEALVEVGGEVGDVDVAGVVDADDGL